MMKKLKENRGESLTEVLVAILIIALGSIMMITMVSASVKIVKSGTERFGTNMTQKNAVEEAADEDYSGNSGTVTISNGKMTSSGGNADFSLKLSGNGISEEADLLDEDDLIVKYKLSKTE